MTKQIETVADIASFKREIQEALCKGIRKKYTTKDATCPNCDGVATIQDGQLFCSECGYIAHIQKCKTHQISD